MSQRTTRTLVLSITVPLHQRIHIGSGLLQSAFDLARATYGEIEDYCVLTDSVVAGRWLGPLTASFPATANGDRVKCVPAVESSKSLSAYTELLNWLNVRHTRRRSVLFLLGGGMIMDLGGFVGSSYMRGIPIVNIPTTLLAQVDASVGGKVAVNLPSVKNIVGAFYCPRLVVIDPAVVHTQDDRGLADGMAEIIKVAVIASAELFELIASGNVDAVRSDVELLARIIELAIDAKLRLLAPDPLEEDLKRSLNLGHTLAHPLESLLGYTGITHGQAVAIGTATAARYGVRRGICDATDKNLIVSALNRYGLPSGVPDIDARELLRRLEDVRRIRDGQLNYVVPRGIGSVEIIPDVDPDELLECMEEEQVGALRSGSC